MTVSSAAVKRLNPIWEERGRKLQLQTTWNVKRYDMEFSMQSKWAAVTHMNKQVHEDGENGTHKLNFNRHSMRQNHQKAKYFKPGFKQLRHSQKTLLLLLLDFTFIAIHCTYVCITSLIPLAVLLFTEKHNISVGVSLFPAI